MKKITTFVIAAVFSSAIFAQTQIINVFHAGGNVSNFGGSDAEKFVGKTPEWAHGYQVGFSTSFGSFFSIEPGVFLIHKGYRTKFKNDVETERFSVNLNYLQIPINAKIHFEIGNVGLSIGAGVYGSVGLFGNHRLSTKGKVNDIKVRTMSQAQIKFFEKEGSSNYRYLPFDFGAQAFLGVNVNRFGVSIGYQPGFFSIVGKTKNALEGTEKLKVTNGTLFLNLSFAMQERL